MLKVEIIVFLLHFIRFLFGNFVADFSYTEAEVETSAEHAPWYPARRAMRYELCFVRVINIFQIARRFTIPAATPEIEL